MIRKLEKKEVPCNGCNACCQNDALMLHPEYGDRIEDYDCEPTINPVTGKPGHMLKHKPDGSCVYLGAGGCSIHDRAPAICGEFDCRKFYVNLLKDTTRPERRRMVRSGLISTDVLAAGRTRAHTLEPPK